MLIALTIQRGVKGVALRFVDELFIFGIFGAVGEKLEGWRMLSFVCVMRGHNSLRSFNPRRRYSTGRESQDSIDSIVGARGLIGRNLEDGAFRGGRRGQRRKTLARYSCCFTFHIDQVWGNIDKELCISFCLRQAGLLGSTLPVR